MANELSTNSTKTDSTISCEVFSSFESLEGMQKEWDSFVESIGCEIFLTHDWCKIWWKYYGGKRELRVFTFRCETKLVGIIPIFLEKIWLGPIFVKVIKIVGTDFTPIAVSLPVNDDFLHEVLQVFFSELVSQQHWDVLYIGPLAGLFDECEKIVSECRETIGQSHRVFIKENGVQTYFKLGENWESYLAGLSKNARHNFKRKNEALSQVFKDDSGSLTSEFATGENIEEWFAQFVQMHQEHWQKLGMSGHFGDWPDSFEYHREMAKAHLRHNRLRLMVCRWGNFCLGYEYAYKFGQIYYAFLNARTDSERVANVNVGTNMFSEQVKKAIAEGVQYIDAMRGKYDYKLQLGGRLFPVRSLYVCRRNFLAAGRVILFRLLSKVLNVCYYKIWYCRVAPRLRLTHRSLWKIWIRSRL